MTGSDCDAVRDLLPHLGGAGVSPGDEALAQDHLGRCAECQEEAALVSMIQSTLEPLPPGLEARVLAAVRGVVPPGVAAPEAAVLPVLEAGARRRAGRRFASMRFALAATVAVAVLGGALALGRVGFPFTAVEPGSEAEFDVSAISLLTRVPSDDAMLHAGTALEELTVEELELLLEELES